MAESKAEIPTPKEMLARARSLIPVLRERAPACEQARRVPDETITEMQAAEVFKLCQPARYGGFGMGWDVACEAAMTLAEGCGSQGWVATVLIEHACIVGMFPEQAQDDVYGENPAALVSSSYRPVGKVERVDGGYILSGRYGFSSGVHHAQWAIIGGLVAKDGDQAPRNLNFLVPESDWTLIDDWHVVGLGGTGSACMEIKDAFVPEHRVITGKDLNDGTCPGSEVNRAPIFRLPHKGMAPLALAAINVGMAKGGVEQFLEMVRTKSGSGTRGSTAQALEIRIGMATAEVNGARAIIVEGARRGMAILAAGNRLTLEERAANRISGALAARLARDAIDRVFEMSGAHGLSLDNNLQRAFRDVHAGGAHTGLDPDLAAMTYTRLRLGETLPAGMV